MQRLDPHYLVAIDPDQRAPSWVVALLPRGADDPGVTATIRHLDSGAFQLVDRRMAAVRQMGGSRWELELQVRWEEHEEPTQYRIWLEPAEQLHDVHLELGYLSPQDLEATRGCRWSMGVSTRFGKNPLLDFHRQLRLLHVVAPRASVTYDLSASWPRGGDWLGDVASSRVPPSPESLYSVHAVMGPESYGRLWLHTHGLLRCGTIELELLDVPSEHTATLANLLGTAAAMTLEMGPPPPDEPFSVGQGLELLWLPWEKGLSHVPGGVPGSAGDRDEFHDHPSGILFVPGERWLGLFGERYLNPERHLPILEDDPLLFVSSLETERMSRLAAEQLDRFLALLETHGRTEGWTFLVKLGYEVDDPQTEDDREHLWFEVHGVDGERFDATLVNEPYSIGRMSQGQRELHPFGLLSDWSVHCPHGSFDPDSIGQLERILAQR